MGGIGFTAIMVNKTHRVEPVWFSAFFGIDFPQYELPFVDFNINSDVPLYIDPYAITKDKSTLAGQCHNAIVSYFETLLVAIRTEDKRTIRHLIRGRLAEPVEIHLGVGKAARKGRGIGVDQEQGIIGALAGSEAARVGVIQAIQELELHISGIGPDKISDLTANVILDHLAGFTEQMSDDYAIATRPVAVNGFWNAERQEWDSGYFNLPVHDTYAYILVPKRFVRRETDLMNHRVFYDKYVLDILQRETLDANDSLVHTLKNGKRRVTKKDLQNDPRFGRSKEFISQFIIEHPQSIEQYRDNLNDEFNPIDPASYSGKSEVDDPDVEGMLDNLKQTETGTKSASRYLDLIFMLVEFLFDWALENFEKEYKMDLGRSRIDIIADNYVGGGLFSQLRQELNATSVPMECKNYTTDLGNNEFNQLMERLSKTTSRFGLLFCRSIRDAPAMLKQQTDRWLRHSIIILLIDDSILEKLVLYRLERNFSAIEQQLRRMIRAVQYGATHDGR